MQLLLFLAFIGLLGVYAQQKIPIDDAPWTVTFIGREYSNGQTTFKYSASVNSLGGTDLASWMIALPNCAEIVVASTIPDIGNMLPPNNPNDIYKYDSLSGINGLEWQSHVAAGKQRAFQIIVNGHIDSENLQYVVSGTGGSSADYAVGFVTGPSCSVVPDAECNAGGQYYGSCVNHNILVSLTSTSKQVKSQMWSVTSSYLSLDNPSAINPLLTINPTSLNWDSVSCSVDHEVSLLVYGVDGEASCVANVNVNDTDAPSFQGLSSVTDIVVESDDIPASPEVRAKDNCDSGVTVSTKESTIGSDPGQYKIVRTWTATDFCHNKVEHVQTITVQDTTPPVMFGIEDDVTVECDVVPPPCEVEAEDYNEVTVSFTEARYNVPGYSCDNYYRLVRTWTAVDSAGNRNSASQEILVRDTVAPVISGAPDSETVECDEVPAAPSLIALDACGANTLGFNEDKVGHDDSNPNNHLIIRTWTALDECGNVDTHIQTVTVVDNSDPVLSGVDADANIFCYEVPPPCVVTVIDNCDLEIDVTYAEETIHHSCIDHYDLSRTWTATDSSGNVASETQLLRIHDLIPPKFTGLPPASLTVQCSDIPQFVVDAEDKCDPNIVVDISETKSPNPTSENEYNLYRNWVAVDRCGNQAKHIQLIEVVDTVPPTLEGVPNDIQVSCNSVPDLQNSYVTVSDRCSCSVDLVVESSEQIHNGVCEHEYTLVRTWSSQDCVGNTVSDVQTIKVIDHEDPIMTGLPGDQQVQCHLIPEFAVVSVSDNCDTGVTIVPEEDRTGGSCTDEYTLVRSWTAVDVCGNDVTHNQNIVVKDTVSPFFDNPNPGFNHQVECNGDPYDSLGLSSPTFDYPTATDLCDSYVDVTHVDDTTVGDCPNDITVVRVYTATDDCGNTATEVQTFKVVDTTPPSLESDFEAEVVVEFPAGADVPAPQVTPVDSCAGVVDVTSDEVTTQWPPCPSRTLKISRTWKATDICGNVSPILTQVITVQDTSPPVITTDLTDLVVACDDIPEAVDVTAVDTDGTSVSVVMTEVSSEIQCLHSYVITRRWVATDECGNDDSFEQVITVEDNLAPVLSGVPNDETTECELPSIPAISVNDACDLNVTVGQPVVTEVLSDVDEIKFIVTRTWTVSDTCGNSLEKSQRVTIMDREDPVFLDVPDATTIECSDQFNVPVLEAVDSCDGDLEVTSSFEEFKTTVCADHVIYHYKWEATDESGHLVTAEQIVTVRDSQGPVFVNPPSDTTAQCSDSLVEPVVEVEDSCDPDVDEPVVERSEEHVENSPQHEYVVIYEYSVDDRCGNTATHQIRVTVSDITPPQFQPFQSLVYLDCTDPISEITTLGADDDCYVVEPTFTDEEINRVCAHSYTIVRHWTVTDGSGNVAQETQTIIIEDSLHPVLESFPAEIDVSHTDVPSYPNITATDNCASVSVSWTSETDSVNCDNNYRLIYTATVEDDCNHVATAVQYVNVLDVIPPVITPQYPDTSIQCGEESYLEDMLTVGTDQGGSILSTDTVTENADCANSYTIRRTWVAIDDCLNKATYTQTVTVVDTTDPVMDPAPADESYECANPQTFDILSVTDNCAGNHLVSPVVVRVDEVNPTNYKLVATWSYSDPCLNSVTEVQTVTVFDSTPPTVTNVPATTTVDYTQIPIGNSDTITCADNCADSVASYSTEQIQGSCVNNYHLVRTWTCTDQSGLTDTVVITVTVEDVGNLAFTNYPGPQTIEWIPGLPDSLPVAVVETNKAGVVPVFTSTNDALNGDTAQDLEFTITRTWTAQDECQNIVTHSQIITIIQPVPPVLPELPPDIYIDCSDVEDYIMGSFIDQATETININVPVDNELTSSITSEAGSCDNEYNIIVTWTATDGAGQTISDDMTIFVTDTVPPTWVTSPAPFINAECAEPPVEVYDALDNCAQDLMPAPTDGFGDSSGQITPTSTSAVATLELDGFNGFIRTYTATDACGNAITATQDVQIVDTQKPVFDNPVPGPVTISCSDVFTPATLTATDNCDDVTVLNDCSGLQNPCLWNKECEWSATDTTGNVVSGVQIITIEDVIPPVFTNDPMPETDLVVECSDIPVKVELAASDNCGVPQINYEETTSLTDCTPYEVTRTYIATDDCGLQTTFIQNLIVQDTNLPVLSGILDDATLECGTSAPASLVTLEDDCDVTTPPFFTPSEVIEVGTCADEVIVHRTWIVNDCSGAVLDSLTQTRNITYIDSTPPTISGISSENREITIVCPDTVIPDLNLAVSDNCDSDVELAVSINTITGSVIDAYNYKVLRTWTATDNCGNTASEFQTVIFEDVTPPTIVCVAEPVTVACNDISSTNPAESFLIPPIVLDSCSNTTLSQPVFKETDNVICTGSYDTVYVWTATDGSGLSSTCEQTLSVVDDMPPYFEIVPVDVTLECGDAIPSAEAVPIVDACSAEVTNTPSEDVTDGTCNGEYTMVRGWDAHDDCGHHATHFQNIVVKDSLPPVLVGVPEDESFSCENVPTPTDHGVTATDVCQTSVDVSFEYDITSAECEDSSGTYDYTLVWSAEDVCGNLVEASRGVSVYDTVNPTLNNVPADTTVDCEVVPNPPEVTLSDNCHDTIIASFHSEQVDGASPFQYEIINTWSGNDPCGNSAEATQRIWVTDDIPPTFTFTPEDTTYECDHIWVVGGLSAEDNCAPGTATVTKDGPKTDYGTCDDEWKLITEWVAVDDAGNTATVSQTISFVDTSPPTLINGPTNVAVECDSIPTSNPLHAEDSCTTDMAPVVATEETIDQTTATDYKLVRTWTVSDSCGNTDVHVQTIYVTDSLKPVLNMAAPEDLEVSCNSVPEPEVITGTDNCVGTITVVYTEEKQQSNTCAHEYILSRAWVAEDASGNKVQVSQVITVTDNSAPSLYPIPEDETVSCEVPWSAPDVQGSDPCGAVTVNREDVKEPGETPSDYVMTYTWTAVDECGNRATAVQVVTFTDNVSPIVQGSPSSEVEVGSVPVPGTGTVTDNCDTTVPPEVPCEESREDSGACESNYTLTYVCHVTDASGNYAEHVYQVIVRDTTPPVFYFDGYNAGVAPPTVTYEYGEVPSVEDALLGVVAVDNSENEIQLEVPAVTTIDGANAHEYTLIWTYSACDDCGNCAEIDRTIVVEDTTPPCLSEEPPSEDVECDNIPPPCEVTTVDEDLEVVTDHTSLFLVGDQKYITRTWSAVDESGNSVTHTQTLRVVDHSPPVFSRYPEAAITVSCSCDSFPLAPTVNAIDNCDFSITVVFVEDKIPSQSPDAYILERTWTAEDESGNKATWRQLITVEDTESPVLSKTPADKHVECDNVPDADDIFMQDNCDPDVQVQYDYSIVGGNCAHTYQIQHRWVGSDRTGNAQNHVQIVTVEDTQAPIFESVESECILPNLQYKEFPTTHMFDVSDNCDGNVQFTIYSCNSTDTPANDNTFFDVSCHFDEQRSILSVLADAGSSSDGRTYEVYAAATDACGNQAYYARQFWIPATEEDAAMEGLICEVADVDRLVDSPY